MFGKLLKYDCRSMLKQFGFIWPAALALALINRFTLGGLDGSSAVGETAAGIAMLVYVAILMAMFVIAVIFVIQRFYKGLLGDEGYLMHTLPVKPWQLVASKLLTAVLATMASVLVAVGSIFLIAPMGWSDLQLPGPAFHPLEHSGNPRRGGHGGGDSPHDGQLCGGLS